MKAELLRYNLSFFFSFGVQFCHLTQLKLHDYKIIYILNKKFIKNHDSHIRVYNYECITCQVSCCSYLLASFPQNITIKFSVCLSTWRAKH